MPRSSPGCWPDIEREPPLSTARPSLPASGASASPSGNLFRKSSASPNSAARPPPGLRRRVQTGAAVRLPPRCRARINDGPRAALWGRRSKEPPVVTHAPWEWFDPGRSRRAQIQQNINSRSSHYRPRKPALERVTDHAYNFSARGLLVGSRPLRCPKHRALSPNAGGGDR
jgi:hypothetical protein